MAAASLQPLQVGVGLPGAAEIVGQALQAHLNQTPPGLWTVLLIDLRNAFNCLRRDTLLQQVASKAPHLLPWVHSCYAYPSHLFFGSQRLRSTTGVQQGDPLGPLLFSLTIQPILDSLPSDLPFNSWYLDDGTICLPNKLLLPTFNHLLQSFKTLGIDLNLSKCTLWGPGLLDPSLQQQLQINPFSRP